MGNTFICNFCGKSFVYEKSFVNHQCTKKKRWLDKDEKYVCMGYNYWLQWLKITKSNRLHNNRKYEDFIQMQLYSPFVKLGRHVLETRMINEHMFLPYVVKERIKIDDWCKDGVYEKYVRAIIKKEPVTTVLERHALLMDYWGRENNENWQDFFKNIHPGLVVKWIRTGRISPWILLLSPTAEEMLLHRFSDEQLTIVNKCIDIPRWKIRISRNNDDRKLVEEAIKEVCAKEGAIPEELDFFEREHATG